MKTYEARYPKKPTPVKITVEGGFSEPNKLELTISADSMLEDWVDVFKTILINQTFSIDAVKELFEVDERGNEDIDINCKSPEFIWKDEF